MLLEQAQQVLPASETYHVGYVRDEETLEAKGVVEILGEVWEGYGRPSSPADCILQAAPCRCMLTRKLVSRWWRCAIPLASWCVHTFFHKNNAPALALAWSPLT